MTFSFSKKNKKILVSNVLHCKKFSNSTTIHYTTTTDHNELYVFLLQLKFKVQNKQNLMFEKSINKKFFMEKKKLKLRRRKRKKKKWKESCLPMWDPKNTACAVISTLLTSFHFVIQQ